MNRVKMYLKGDMQISFRPQQGLTIMNRVKMYLKGDMQISFRPQQGLTIMNIKQCVPLEKDDVEFPSPTGVNYYEYKKSVKGEQKNEKSVSVPNRG